MKKHYENSNQSLKDKLYNYEEQPLPDSWKKISGGLDLQKSKAKQTTNRLKLLSYTSVSAVALVVASILIFQSSPENKITITTVENPSKDSIHIEENVDESRKVETNNMPVKPKLLTRKTGNKKATYSLPDGSKVTLNRYSDFFYDENFTDRIVTVHGEAFFEVKSDEAHPLIVYGNRSRIQVSATSFELRSYSDEIYDEVNVKKGKISIESRNEKSKKAIILAGYKVSISDTIVRKEAIVDDNFDAWKTEKIVFHDTGLKEVFSTLENYYQISIATNSPKILNCRFTGVFEKSEINEILQVLSVSFDLSYNENSKNYILSGKGCN